MRLYIVQHGDSVTKEIDPDRPLSDQGQADIQRLAEWLSSHNVRIAQILHSGKTRAKETAVRIDLLWHGDSLLQPLGGYLNRRKTNAALHRTARRFCGEGNRF